MLQIVFKQILNRDLNSLKLYIKQCTPIIACVRHNHAILPFFLLCGVNGVKGVFGVRGGLLPLCGVGAAGNMLLLLVTGKMNT